VETLLPGGGGNKLIIRTDQESLKFMMTQRLSESIQHKLLLELLKFNYIIEYKKGKENKVADALSRKETNLVAISSATPAWVVDIEASYSRDQYYTYLIHKLLIDTQAVPDYPVHSGILRYKGRICIGVLA
jgi:hypothetical protein